MQAADGKSLAIHVAGLEKHYGATRAVDGLSFDVARGEVFGLLGPNGAGKTTTVEILEGYRTPDAGTVRVLGLDPIKQGRELKPRIGVMLQEGGLYPGLKPLELLRLFAAYYDEPEDPEAMLDVVGLRDTAATPVRRLSGGQAQRLSLACALIGKPQVLFLDEPTAGMDPHARATTWQLVRDLRAREVTVLLTTHAMDEAEQLCDRVAIIAGGKLAALGSPAELTRYAAADEIWFAATPGIDTIGLARARRRSRGRRRGSRGRVSRAGRRHPGPGGSARMFPPGSRRHARRIAIRPAFSGGSVPADHGRGTLMTRRALIAQARAETMLQLRRGENMMVTLAIPLGILVFFAKVDTIATDFADPVDFLVPGVLSLSVMAAAMVSLGIATGFERRYGVLKRLGATPLSRGGLLMAKTATVLAIELVQVLLVVVVGAAIGWDVPAGIAPAAGLLLLGTVAFAGIGMLMAGTLRAEANLAAANGLFLVLLFLGGMAYPLSKLPAAMQDFAKLLPAAALSETVRAVLASRAFPVGELIVLVAWAIAAPLLAARYFRWEE